MTDEIRVFGPPGTGKTTYLAERVHDTAKHRGTDRIVVGSFTKTAAAEIAGRGLPVPRHQIGTLHSLAYRAIGKHAIAEEALEDWNRKHRDLAMTPGNTNIDDGAVDMTGSSAPGDRFMREIDGFRARMVPVEQWPHLTRLVWNKWCEWKTAANVIDFTDMIEMALADTECAPGNPVVGFFDEVQDFTALELALVRKWGEAMDRLVLAGDDDQCIFGFTGADPAAFLYPPVSEDHKRLLTQSYRVPVAVHDVAQRWIQQVTEREEKDYHPRDFEGVVRLDESMSIFNIDPLLREVEEQTAAGRTTMILTACSYMLEDIVRGCRRLGLPIHNPYRRSRGDWNPLGGRSGTSSAERLAAYLAIDPDLFGDAARPWTGGDLQAWTSVIRAQGTLIRGAKTTIEGMDPAEAVPWETLEGLFVDSDVLDAAVAPSIDWFADRLLASRRRAMQYPLAVARRREPRLLIEPPRTIVGTVHSVKGGEADVVYLFGDLPNAAARHWTPRATEDRDAIIRQFYVGMTRAREELVLVNGADSESIDFARWVGR